MGPPRKKSRLLIPIFHPADRNLSPFLGDAEDVDELALNIDMIPDDDLREEEGH